MTIEKDYLNSLMAFMEETFEAKHHGIFLDRGTSLFETLDTISAAEASIPVGGKCASLAAQVAHVVFYMDVVYRAIVYNDNTPADWGEIWRTVERVTPAEWEEYKGKLREAYERMSKLFQDTQAWNEDAIGNSMAIVVHTAYHLGEIRQALCTLK